ncbi:unnamed protein product [Closterium sp. NIES-54]
MEVACTSLIHVPAPHFLWTFASDKPRISSTSGPGSLALVRDPPAGKLSPCTVRCVFLGFPTDAPPWQFYHPTTRRNLSSYDVTFDVSVCYYRLFPHCSSPMPPPPLFLVPGYPPVDLPSPLATAVTHPSFESAAASALVAERLDFAAACRLDYATALVAESVSASPPSVEGECALGTDVLEDRQEDFECLAAAIPRFASMLLAPEGDPDAPDIPTPRSYAEAITGPYSSQWQAAMDAKMESWKSTGTYVDEVPPSRANIVDGMWIFRVNLPPGSPPAFKARYVAQGFNQRLGFVSNIYA